MTGIWAAVISRDVEELSEPAYFVIPGFADDLRFGPCRWQSRDATSTPSAGNACLVIFDDRGVPWIPVWWPF